MRPLLLVDDELIVYSCSFDVSDERLMGEVETVVLCDFTVEGATTLGQCAGTSAIHNAGGAGRCLLRDDYVER